MQNIKNIKELLNSGGARIRALKIRGEARRNVLAAVRASLPPLAAEAVISARIDQEILTLGVTSGGWATRLRSAAADRRRRGGAGRGAPIR